MNDEEIKIIGSVRVALIHQKFTSYMPVAMDEAIEKLTNLMREHFEHGTQHTNKGNQPDAKNFADHQEGICGNCGRWVIDCKCRRRSS